MIVAGILWFQNKCENSFMKRKEKKIRKSKNVREKKWHAAQTTKLITVDATRKSISKSLKKFTTKFKILQRIGWPKLRSLQNSLQIFCLIINWNWKSDLCISSFSCNIQIPFLAARLPLPPGLARTRSDFAKPRLKRINFFPDQQIFRYNQRCRKFLAEFVFQFRNLTQFL